VNKHSHVQIDETDPEGTHLWVELHNHDGTVDTIVGQYLKEHRQHAYAMAKNLADAIPAIASNLGVED
jgi:hypothetical protein